MWFQYPNRDQNQIHWVMHKVYQVFSHMGVAIRPLFPHVNTARTIFRHEAAIYNLTTLCLNGAPVGVDFVDITMGEIPVIFQKYPFNAWNYVIVT